MWRIALGVGLVVVGCSSSSGGSPGEDQGEAGAGAGARPGSGGEPNGPGASGEAGASDGDGGTAGSDGAAGEASSAAGEGPGGGSGGGGGVSNHAPPLPEGALLYVFDQGDDHDLLVAVDLDSGDQRVVTDLTGDGSSGWRIHSYSLSPDRRRIALASLYAPTSADTATGLATNAIWTLDTEGASFRRLTPTFPKDTQGRQGFQYAVGSPEWTADGSYVVYDFGSYWWEGTALKGGSFPWAVAADGKSPPTSLDTDASCSVLYPSRNPVTGDFLFIHSVCVPGQGAGNGIYLYPAAGDADPTQLVSSAHVSGAVDVYLTKPSWFSDGSGFLFVGGLADTDWRPSLLVYDAQSAEISLVVPAPEGTSVRSAAVSPDSSKIVYCAYDEGTDSEDLRLIDLALASPTDVALTTDGSSCAPSF